MSELIGQETHKRLEDVEQQIRGVSSEMLRISAEIVKHQQQLKILEETYQRHQDELRKLFAAQEVIKASMDRLHSRFDSFENRVFDLLRQAQSDGLNERKTSQKEWISFLKYVLGGTILALVGYVGYLIKSGGQ